MSRPRERRGRPAAARRRARAARGALRGGRRRARGRQRRAARPRPGRGRDRGGPDGAGRRRSCSTPPARRCAIVANFAVGYDNVDLDACRARGRDRHQHARRPDQRDRGAGRGADAGRGPARGRGRADAARRRLDRLGPGRSCSAASCRGSTVGIVGPGADRRCASPSCCAVSRRSSSTRSRTPRPEAESRLGLERAELDALVERSDFVTLHAPLTAETRHLVDARLLDRFKPGAILVNTARGAPRRDGGARRGAPERTARRGRPRRLRARARGRAGAARARERRAPAARRLRDRRGAGLDGAARRRERDRGTSGKASPDARFALTARLLRQASRGGNKP